MSAYRITNAILRSVWDIWNYRLEYEAITWLTSEPLPTVERFYFRIHKGGRSQKCYSPESQDLPLNLKYNVSILNYKYDS